MSNTWKITISTKFSSAALSKCCDHLKIFKIQTSSAIFSKNKNSLEVKRLNSRWVSSAFSKAKRQRCALSKRCDQLASTSVIGLLVVVQNLLLSSALTKNINARKYFPKIELSRYISLFPHKTEKKLFFKRWISYVGQRPSSCFVVIARRRHKHKQISWRLFNFFSFWNIIWVWFEWRTSVWFFFFFFFEWMNNAW